ncbi:hypothetical protein BY458DRAFT_495841 [Sporodiniella umbellata]|nr:hypothetical protein BY458DRAFT_495841 [Sporodiniella umbellata]
MEVANHVLESVLRDLSFLKDHQFLNTQTYQEVISLLPTQISAVDHSALRPPLPIRKSNSSSTQSVVNGASREMTSALPKLPVRRTQEWSPQPKPRTPEPEKMSSPSPPAYVEQTPTCLVTAEALYDYRGEDPATDLSFKQGDIIEVTEYVNDDWWKGSIHGKAGIFPQNHVKKLPPPIKAKRPPQPPIKPDNNTPSYGTTTTTTTQMPYIYPPPPTTLYQPPPITHTYTPPPLQAYPPPAGTVTQPAAVAPAEEESKVSNITKKFGGQVATAATWGFGATLGSQAASAIF